MKFRFATLATTALLCLFISQEVQAQSHYQYDWAAYRYRKALNRGKNMKRWWKEESSLGLAFAGPITVSTKTWDNSTPESSRFNNTTITNTAKPTFSVYGNLNRNGLLARTSENSMISLSYGGNVEYLRYNVEVLENATDTVLTPTVLGFGRGGIPITVDFKYGCDVNFTSEPRLSFSAGGGVMPNVGFFTASLVTEDYFYSVSPYFYASVGFFAWGCWKIRAAAIPGKYVNFSSSTGNALAGTSSSASGSNVFNVGLIYMPHSSDWGTANGYRTGWGKGRSHRSSRFGRR